MPSWGPDLVNKLISISISMVNKVVTKLWLCLLPGMQTTISSMSNVQYKKKANWQNIRQDVDKLSHEIYRIFIQSCVNIKLHVTTLYRY